MNLSTWLVFAAVAIVPILIPGPAIFLAITNSVNHGWRRVAFSSLGNVLGLLAVSSFAMAGLGTLLRASASAFAGLRLVGAGYLIYLGLRQWRSRSSLFSQESAPSSSASRSNGALLRQGLLVALTNPKAILFFTAFFPQFIKPKQALIPQFLLLTATFMVESFLTLMGYGILAHAARTWFADERRSTWFNRVSGGVFILLGLGVLRLERSRT